VSASCESVGISRASYYRAIAQPSTELSPAGDNPAVPSAMELSGGPAPAGHEITPAVPAVAAEPTCDPALAGPDLAPAIAAVTCDPAPAGPDLAPAAPAVAAEPTSDPAPACLDLAPVPAVPTEPTCDLAPAVHTRSLTVEERQSILDVLHSERFIDRAPAEVYHTLLDEGVYIMDPEN